MTIILIFFTTCDAFNTPLKEYIEYATGRAAAGDYLITTQYHEMKNGVIAIPPSDEAEYTKIILDIDNPKKGSIKLEIEGAGSEFASVNLNNNGQASITIKNQKRGFIYDLSVNVYVNGRQTGEPKKLPKLQNRYFNNEIISLKVNSPPGSLGYPDVFYNPSEKNYWVKLYSGVDKIEIIADLHPNSEYTINGKKENRLNVPDDVTEISIIVNADCELTETYTLIVYKFGLAPVITVTSNGKTTNHATLGSAYSSISDLDEVIEIKVYKTIPILADGDLFNLSSTSPKQISLSTDVNNMGGVIITLGRDGSMFTINKNITLILGGGKGELSLEGYSLNYSSLINVNGGALELHEGAVIYNNRYNAGSTNYGGGVSVTNEGTFSMYGGSIEENFAADGGGGVYVANGAFNMYGGSIEKNTTDYEGGGVCIKSGGAFSMNGGSIEGNKAVLGGGVSITNGGVFNMKGGNIEGNKVIPIIGASGGGVSVTGASTFNMDGGTIGGPPPNGQNTATNGGGVYIHNSTFNFLNGIIGDPKADREPVNSSQAGNYSMGNGGGVFFNGLDFNFIGQGRIVGNWADGDGGGVYRSADTYNGPQSDNTDFYEFNVPNNFAPTLP